MRQSSASSIAGALWLTIVAACDTPDEGSTLDLTSVRDPDVPLWTISASPNVLIANAVTEEGDSVPLFRIREAMFGTEAGGPNIVVGVTTGEHALIYLSSAGELLTTRRRGGGPGEIATTRGLFDAGENMGVWDGKNRRITVLSSDGIVVDELSTEAARAAGATNVIGFLGDTLPVLAPFRIPEGEHWYYHVWDFDDGLVGELVGARESAPDSHILLELLDDGGKPTPGTEMTSLLGCLPETRHVALGDRIFFADDANGVIRSVDLSGKIRAVFKSERRATISLEMLEAVREQIVEAVRFMDAMPGPGGRVRRRHLPTSSLDAVLDRVGDPGDPLPSTWSDMIADRSGRLWLRRSACYAPGSHTTWQVVDTAGTLLANAAISDSVYVRAIVDDRVLGVVRDSLGIEYLAVFEIER